MRYDDVRERFRAVSRGEHGRGASADEIAEAEAELGVALPESYKAFVREFGWGVAGPYEVNGLGADAPAHLELVRVTFEERREFVPLTPQPLVPISNDGGGNLYCLDTARTVDGECPVVRWDHEEGEDQIPSREADDFAHWLSARLDLST